MANPTDDGKLTFVVSASIVVSAIEMVFNAATAASLAEHSVTLNVLLPSKPSAVAVKSTVSFPVSGVVTIALVPLIEIASVLADVQVNALPSNEVGK